ncbi:hypothetical protein P7D15_01885 [Bacillus cereus]|uniref:hypothetical protein n=1 Tax=Bacillus cereus TaxID=1396 RepID=UPI00240527DE|nr:hypothetical protein [Bacillus cereus]MDF9599167.1 hypothetical protein [Bacillus cereus]MDG1589500.1 hypothetical protein [Bacillus cereus]
MCDKESEEHSNSNLFLYALLPLIAFLLPFLKPELSSENFIKFVNTLIGVLVFVVVCISITFLRREYNRIKRKDFVRIKEQVTQHVKEHYYLGMQDSFILIDKEKDLTRKEILKRCFSTYKVKIPVFAPSGEFLYEVKVNEQDVEIINSKRVSHVSYGRELYVYK